MPEIKIGEQTVVIERFTLTKAMRVITLLSVIQKSVPEINKAMADFKRTYGEENVEELDRVQAKMRFGPRPVLDDDGDPLLNKETGELLTLPSPVDRMSEQDWERSGQILRLRDMPSSTEMVTAIFPLVYEQAEQPVQRLLALVAMANRDVHRYVKSGEIWARVDELADELIAPAYLEEVMELAVTAAEQVETQVMTKAKDLGDRVGKLARQLGLQRVTQTSQPASETSSDTPETPKTDSVSRSLSDGDGQAPTPSSSSLGTPSERSATTSNATS